MAEIFQLVYFSEAVEDLSYTDLQDILEVSRKNNDRDEITGLLLYRDDYFIQVLEGQADLVRRTLERIRHDDRNYKVKVLYEGTAGERMFAHWNMAFHDGDLSSNHNPFIEKLFTNPKSLKREDILPLLRALTDLAPEFK